MTKQVSLDVFGITFYVTVEYEDNSVCGVSEVRLDPYGEPIKCNTEDFFKSLDGMTFFTETTITSPTLA